MRQQFYRSIFLSDFHIGAKAFDAPALLKFLREHDCDYLYLVGDIIDGWKFNKRWYWTQDYTDILCELLLKSQNGTKIYYLPGNHDEDLRFSPLPQRQKFAKLMHVTIKNRIVHNTVSGKRFLVMHGDQFDRKILRGPLSRWSDEIYDALLEWLKHVTKSFSAIPKEQQKFSLAKYLQKQGAKALSVLNNFEKAVYEHISTRKLDGLICGHTHIPIIKPLQNITYANCGSWLRTGHTALVEDDAGHLELVDYPCSLSEEPELLNLEQYDQYYDSDLIHQAQSCIAMIKEIWPCTKKTSQKRSFQLYKKQITIK